MAEMPWGSVHESPVRGQRTRPTLKTGTPSLECIIEDLSEANAGKGQLCIDCRRKLLRIILIKNVVWGANALEPIAHDARAQATASTSRFVTAVSGLQQKKPRPRNSGGAK
jgi:hypothetical protein